MKISWDKVINVALRYLPTLITFAEGLFSFKKKSGGDKKKFVSDSMKLIVGAVADESTGGQADTWEKLEGPIGTLIDSTVEVLNSAGAFSDGPAVSPNIRDD